MPRWRFPCASSAMAAGACRRGAVTYEARVGSAAAHATAARGAICVAPARTLHLTWS